MCLNEGTVCAWICSGMGGYIGLGTPEEEQLKGPESPRLSCEKPERVCCNDVEGEFCWNLGEGTWGGGNMLGDDRADPVKGRGTVQVLQTGLRPKLCSPHPGVGHIQSPARKEANVLGGLVLIEYLCESDCGLGKAIGGREESKRPGKRVVVSSFWPRAMSLMTSGAVSDCEEREIVTSFSRII
jgi:hypothetical protein